LTAQAPVQALVVRASRVAREEIHSTSLPIDKNVAESGARHADARGASIVRCRQRMRRVAAAAGKRKYCERQRAEEGE